MTFAIGMDMENRPGLYAGLVLREKLYPHLLVIEDTTNERLNRILPDMARVAGSPRN